MLHECLSESNQAHRASALTDVWPKDMSSVQLLTYNELHVLYYRAIEQIVGH